MTRKSPTSAELAADWIASRRDGADLQASGHLADLLLADFPQSEPELTWDAIKSVMQAYPTSDFYAESMTEAQIVCGLLAAGPVEDLLSFHGHQFIERFEQEARRDQRMAWLLGGAWQFLMPDDIWHRVERAADKSYWMRPAS